jgi:hypothetical protein
MVEEYRSTELLNLEGLSKSVQSVAFSPDGGSGRNEHYIVISALNGLGNHRDAGFCPGADLGEYSKSVNGVNTQAGCGVRASI